MRSLLKYYLPLLLTLLVPLGALAWFGSQELSRLETRTQSILQDEAHRFLTNAEFKVRTEIQRLAHRSLTSKVGTLLADPRLSIVEASNQLGAEPFILQAFVTDAEFQLVAPRAPKVQPPSAPLSSLPEEQDSDERELLRADILQTQMRDDEGAMTLLESYIERYEREWPRSHSEGLTWAYFYLAGLNDKNRDDPERTVELYYSANIQAERTCQREPNEDAASVILLSDLRLAQINVFSPSETMGPSKDLRRVLERICTGRQDFIEYIAEDLLQSVTKRIDREIHADPSLLALNRTRSTGRRFALDYESHAQPRLRTEYRSGRKYEYKGVIFHALTTDQSTGLLVLRPATAGETKRYDGTAAWVGLLLDLPALVGRSLGDPTSPPGNIALTVNDPSGVALLPDESLAAPSAKTKIQFAPILSEIAGLEYVAISITDPGELQRTTRNQLLMGLILITIAAAGGFMLIRSIKRENELAQTKVLLLSRVSHELKTPLAVIKMYGETLGLGRTKDQVQTSRFANIISSEADRLTGMVERILDFSRMEAGTFEYDKEMLDLSALIQDVTEEYLPHVESQGLDLHWEIQPKLFAEVDRQGMASSLVSLLENALKYTPADCADSGLDVSLRRSGGHAMLEVRDRGVGIPPDELGRVFEDFYRASNAGEARGAGLGLSLVQHFARAHNGVAEALARPGGGTIMRITLPLATPTDPVEPTAGTT